MENAWGPTGFKFLVYPFHYQICITLVTVFLKTITEIKQTVKIYPQTIGLLEPPLMFRV